MAITNLNNIPKPEEEQQQQQQAQPQESGGHGGWDAVVLANNPDVVPSVGAFNPHTTEVPQNVLDAQQQYADINIATQEYADDWQKRIIRDYNGYVADENYQGTLNKTLTNQAYNYLKRANNGADYTAWTTPNPEDELFTKYLPDIVKTEETRRQAEAEMKKQLPTAEDKMVQNVYSRANSAQKAVIDAGTMEHGSWYLMSPLEKAKYLIVPGSNATTMDNMPEWTKYITNIAPSVMAGGGGAMLGSLVPIPGFGTITGIAVGGLTYLQGVTGIQIPVINDVLQFIDLGEKVEPYFTGGLSAISKAYESKYGDTPFLDTLKSGNFDIIDLATTTADILKDPNNKYLWEVSKYGYEVGADAMDDIIRTIRNAGAAASDKLLGTEFGQRTADQVSRANIGRSGLENLVEGTYGADSLLDTYLPLFTDFVNEAMSNGMSEKEAIQFAHENFQQYVLNYTGTTGLVNDLAAQSVVDPANIAPFLQGKTAETIGKITGDKALQNAGKAAAGNPLIDILPPGIQQGAEGVLSMFQKNPNAPDILKTYGSQGMDIIKSTIREAYRGQYDVNKLSGWQRYIAGIDKDGYISELRPNAKSGNAVKDWVTNLFKTTNDTKMFDVSMNTADFLGSAIFNSDTQIYKIPDLVEQLAGRQPITPDSPIARFQNTAMLKTLQDQFTGMSDVQIQNITESVQNYRKFDTNRAVVDKVAQELGMTQNEIFDALDNKGLNEKDPRFRNMTEEQRKAALDAERQELYRKIREKDIKFEYTDADNNTKVLNPDDVIKKIEVFKTNTDTTYSEDWVGRKQYSESYLKASIMTQLADFADTFNLIRYDIEPDAWAVRTANLMKDIQSIALLNFSTSYQVNNFLNNMLTRSVAGVGGFDPKFINDVNKARGLSFERTKEGGIYERTSNKIGEAKKPNDRLQKVKDFLGSAKDSKLLKGVNNLDVEGIETNAAWNIGANRYWDATWGGNIPDIPKSWEALGITKDMKNQIFKIALDSPTQEAFRAKLMGEVILPGAASTLKQMLENNFTGDSKTIMQDFFATKPWITDDVEGFLKTGDARLVEKGFNDLMDKLTNEVGLQNLVQFNDTFDDLRVRYSREGIGAAATAFEALNDLYGQMWIKQTKENSTLFIDRAVGAINPDNFDAEYKARMDIQTNDYNIVRGYTLLNLGAMIEGLGLDSEAGVALMNNAMQFFDLGESYVKQEHALYQKYAKTESDSYNFKKYRAEKMDMLQKNFDAQLKATEEFHKTMVNYLRNNLNDGWTGHIDAFEKSLGELLKQKEEYNKTELKDLQKRLDTSGRNNRARVSREQEKSRRVRKQQIHDGYEAIAKQLKQMEGGMQTKTTPATPQSLESTLRIQMLHEEAKHQKTYAEQALKKGDNHKKVFEPLNFDNKIINGESFNEYGAKKIVSDAVKSGVDPKEAVGASVVRYYKGDGIPLGFADAVHDSHYIYTDNGAAVDASGAKATMPIGDKFELVNPDANLKANPYTVARSKPFMWGNDIANAGVFHNGELIGYITGGMQETVTVNGKTYPVIGISSKDPNTYLLYIRNRVTEVTPGKPKGIDYTIYAKDNFHPGGIGDTPTIQQMGTAALESSYGVREALRMWKDQALSDLGKARENGSLFGKMTDAQRQAVFEWMDGDLRQAYNAQRYMTQRYAETMVDAALLNYNKRYGFDNMLTMLCPYQFWMTRSMANWAKRMISQPAWFSMYYRLQKLIEKNKKDFLPTRLEGLVGIPMPNMGDGMGDSWYFDVANVIFPFQQFLNITDYFVGNLNTIHQNTLTQLDEMHDDGLITDEQYEEASQSKGDLYWKLFEENRRNDETDTSATGLLGTFLSPPVWADAIRKHIQGRDKDISYTPMYRMGNLIKATGDNTMLEDMTNLIGGVLQLPENGLRRAFSIESNPDGNFADYGIVSNIANMMTEMAISENQALNAIAEGPGNPTYDQAAFLYRQQQAARMQGGPLALEIGQSLGGNKDTSFGQFAGSAIASLFGAKTFADGERMHREHQQIYRDMIKKLDKEGKAYKQFWKDYPDYSVHGYSYEDDPKARLHRVVLDNLQNAYYALPESQQIAAQRAFGDRFQKLFINKETRATNWLEIDEMLQWTRAMQGNVPNLNDAAIEKSLREAQQINWYANSVQGDYDKFIAEKDRRFPGIDTVEEGYYNTPANMQEQYKQKNPMLQKYWTWKQSVREANPQLDTYLNDRSAHYQVGFGRYPDITTAVMSKLNDWTLKQLQNHIDNGFAINPDAERTLKKTYNSLQVNVPYETWLKSLVK